MIWTARKAHDSLAWMTPSNRRYLDAAEGWLGSGDWRSANDELAEITPSAQIATDPILKPYGVNSASGSTNPVTVTVPGDAKFYRLFKP